MLNPLRYLIRLAATAFAAPMPPVKRFKTGAALRNPADPTQAARIKAAAAKRGSRARKLHNHVVDSVLPNRAHGAFLPDEDGEIRFSVVPRLNPFYIAK